MTEPVVLIVDDSEENRLVLRDFAVSHGYATVLAADGEAGLRAAREHAPDVMLLDILMPGIDGVEVLRRLKASDTLRSLPVIVISAVDEDDLVAECLELGADDYLTKPFKGTLLQARIQGCLARERLHRQEQEHQALLQRYNTDLETQVAEQVKKVRAVEQQLLQAQKMEYVGALAAGVAHDFNNILQSIIGYTSLVLQTPGLDTKSKSRLTEVEKASHRAAKLTQQLLGMSRRREGDFRPVNVNWLLEDVANFLKSTLPPDVRLEVSKDKSVGAALADASQIQQVLMNLCVNARDAMDGGGTLQIRTEHAEITEGKLARALDLQLGNYVRLRVRDTGSGMDADTLSHLFEPFFTTKEEGKGTGLGLSIVYNIVRRHGGAVAVESVVGEGTTFEVYLPAIAEEVGAEAPAEQVTPISGDETILVVDDDRFVLGAYRQVLENYGYTCLVAHDGIEALRVLENASTPVDLLLTDLLMPEMGGRALAQEVRARNPAIKVVLMTAFPFDDERMMFLREGADAFLRKPSVPVEVSRIVRNTLDGGAPDGQT